MFTERNKNVVSKYGLYENYIFRVIYNISKIIVFKWKPKKIVKAIFPTFIYRTRIKNIMQATKEFCGKCIAVPLVKLAVETYSPPNFPPKLQWYEFQPRKDCTGSILAAFELLEVSLYRFFSRSILYIRYPCCRFSVYIFFFHCNTFYVCVYIYVNIFDALFTFIFQSLERTRRYVNTHISIKMYACIIAQTENKEVLDVPLDMPAEDKIYSIPSDIRPKMASYRLEVIFWGVRDMRKIHCLPVRKPRIIVECAGIHVKSEVMKNAKRFGNFEESRIIIDLVISKISD